MHDGSSCRQCGQCPRPFIATALTLGAEEITFPSVHLSVSERWRLRMWTHTRAQRERHLFQGQLWGGVEPQLLLHTWDSQPSSPHPNTHACTHTPPPYLVFSLHSALQQRCYSGSNLAMTCHLVQGSKSRNTQKMQQRISFVHFKCHSQQVVV